jgi:hypothetical protein
MSTIIAALETASGAAAWALAILSASVTGGVTGPASPGRDIAGACAESVDGAGALQAAAAARVIMRKLLLYDTVRLLVIGLPHHEVQ